MKKLLPIFLIALLFIAAKTDSKTAESPATAKQDSDGNYIDEQQVPLKQDSYGNYADGQQSPTNKPSEQVQANNPVSSAPASTAPAPANSIAAAVHLLKDNPALLRLASDPQLVKAASRVASAMSGTTNTENKNRQ